LTNHYNSNISSLVKIFSEPFNKPSYNIEDFLDHSYGTMLDAEMARRAKKPPVINHEIPQQLKDDSGILARLWEF